MKVIALATLAALLMATGCATKKQSDLPSITRDGTPFIRVTEMARMDLLFSAIRGKPTPTTATVESIIGQQRVVGTETLEKGSLYIPTLTDHKNPRSIVTITVVEYWALVETAVWDERKYKPVITAGFIPRHVYGDYLLMKEAKRNDK